MFMAEELVASGVCRIFTSVNLKCIEQSQNRSKSLTDSGSSLEAFSPLLLTYMKVNLAKYPRHPAHAYKMVISLSFNLLGILCELSS
jgi:hypothetical protein